MYAETSSLIIIGDGVYISSFKLSKFQPNLFQIFYRALNRVGSGKVESFPSGNTLSASISNLEPFVTYEFKVLAYTKQGQGPYSKAVTARTKESSK